MNKCTTLLLTTAILLARPAAAKPASNTAREECHSTSPNFSRHKMTLLT